eukprot:scaffold434_cov186-Pinguiococcus_pyrenoidosus.AAC.128
MICHPRRRLGFVLHYYAGDEILVEREDEQTRRYRDLTGVQQRVVASLDGQQDPYKVRAVARGKASGGLLTRTRTDFGDVRRRAD